jgi:hypothetical protein
MKKTWKLLGNQRNFFFGALEILYTLRVLEWLSGYAVFVLLALKAKKFIINEKQPPLFLSLSKTSEGHQTKLVH